MKKLVWPGVIILGIILIVGGVAGVGKAVFGNRFAAKVAELKARCKPTTVEELIGAPIPDAQNAAVPYMKLHNEIESGRYKKDLDTLSMFASYPSRVSPKVVEKALARTRPLRPMVEDAVSRPRCRFEPSSTNPFAMLFPHLASIRGVTRMYGVSGEINARNGRMDQAADDIHMAIKVAQSMRDEADMIHHCMRLAALSIAARTTTASARYGTFSEKQARMLFDAFGRFDMARSVSRGWDGERVMYIFMADSADRDQIYEFFACIGISLDDVRYTHGALASAYGQTVMLGDVEMLLQAIDRHDEGRSLSYPKAKAAGLLDANPRLPAYAVISENMLPMLASVAIHNYATETDIAMAQVLLALQAYKARYGGYPASVRELRSKLGWKLPKDPFSGKSLIYRRQAKGFTLYSVGPDMKDDCGRPVRANNPIDVSSKGDIVLRLDR